MLASEVGLVSFIKVLFLSAGSQTCYSSCYLSYRQISIFCQKTFMFIIKVAQIFVSQKLRGGFFLN